MTEDTRDLTAAAAGDTDAFARLYARHAGVVQSLCRQGLSLVFISAELDEVARMSDDVLVLRDRRPVGELHGPDVNEPAIMSAIAGDENGSDAVLSS